MALAGNKRLLKVLILGDMGVGKTCLMRRLIYDQFDVNAFPTIGVEFLTKEMTVRDVTYTLQIWDTAGQEKFRSLRTPFYRGADLCMLTYSLVDRNSFFNLQYWLKEFIFHAGVSDSFPFVVVGTKLDLPCELRDVPLTWAETWCHENGIKMYMETSSKKKTNVEEAFSMGLEAWIGHSAHQSPQSNLEFSFSQMELRPDDLIRIKKCHQLEMREKNCCLKR